MRLFLVAYPRNSTDALLSVVHKAGLRPRIMDLAPLALARCVNANRAILVNAWLTFVDIIILSDRIPLVIRSLSLPVEDTSLQERLPSISEELNRTITFYNTTYPDKPLDKSIQLFVCGDIAREQESLQYLENLGYPVAVLKPALNFKDVFNPTQYMVNVGLALKGQLPGGAASQYSMIDFNALPSAYQTPAFSWTRVLIPVGGAVAVGVLIFFAMITISLRSETSSLDQQYSEVQLQAIRLRASNRQIQTNINTQNEQTAALSASADAIQSQIDKAVSDNIVFKGLITGLKTDLDTTDRDVREIVSLVPAGVNINTVDYQVDGITVAGAATSPAAVMNYARALRTGGRFESVTVISVETLGTNVFGFTLILR